MKKREKKEKEYTSDDMKRYLGAMEEFNADRFKAIQEYLPSINKKLDDHSRVFETHTEMMGNIAIKIGHIELRIGHLELALEAVKEDIGLIKNGMKRKVDYEEFEALTRRVLVIERRVLK